MYFKFNFIDSFKECKTEKQKSQFEQGQPNKVLALHIKFRCGSLSITTPVSPLANEFEVPSILHGQVSLATVNRIYVVHENMQGCKSLKIQLKACFENVNIAS